MKYTVRYAHLKNKPPLVLGSIVRRGDVIGVMGNTGKSTAPHLHIDCVEGEQATLWRLRDMEDRIIEPSVRQIQYFIDDELFNIRPVITTHYNDLDYFLTLNKIHLAYDVVPEDRHKTDEHFKILWNRSMPGTVIFNDFDLGYGNTLLVRFEV